MIKRLPLKPILLLLTAFVLQNCARAASIEAPQLQPGRYVYTVPEGYDPPLIGRSGLQEMEREAEKLHYPFYVIIAEEFDGRSDDDLSDALDQLAEDFSRQPSYKRAESSIFVLTYSPRKYRLLAASKWRASLGLEGDGSKRFSDIFARYAKGSSKDPATGIIECMKALDSFAFENNDPARIAARAEAERRAGEPRRLQAAASLLDDQINRMEVLLSQQQFLPPDTSPYRSSLTAAKSVRAKAVAAQMLPAAAALKLATDRLEGTVSRSRAAWQAEIDRKEAAARAAAEARRAEEMKRLQAQLIAVLCGALVLGLMTFLYTAQRREYKGLQAKFKKILDFWEQPLRNAAENHVRFFEERMAVTELESTTGHTKEKYDEITREIGTVYPKVEAMTERIERAKSIFAKGSFFVLKPMKEAIALMDADFEFDTETLNRKALFEPPSRMLHVKPTELRSQMEQLYSENIADWDELMKALQLRATIAQDAFPQARLADLLTQADERNIPHGYFAGHPLFGADDLDNRLYDELNSIRLSDPLQYKERLDSLEKTQAELESLLARLVAAIDLAASRRVTALPLYSETVLAPEDDPALTLSQANRSDELQAGYVTAQKDIELIEQAAQTTADTYIKAVEQAGAIQAAIAHINDDIAALAIHVKNAEALLDRAQARLQRTQAVHRNTGTAETSLNTGRDYLKRGSHLAEKTTRLLTEKRHLDARKSVQEADRQLALAEEEFSQCLGACDSLDAVKAQYERQAALTDEAMRQAQTSIHKYGGNVRLNEYRPPRFSGPVDYALLVNQVNSYRQELETAARNVRLQYEQEQAEIAREQERRRQAEESRRRSESSSSWSSSSSSGSSWSDSFSSSSGGSWSDSSSSSSSSSSSGGDW